MSAAVKSAAAQKAFVARSVSSGATKSAQVNLGRGGFCSFSIPVCSEGRSFSNLEAGFFLRPSETRDHCSVSDTHDDEGRAALFRYWPHIERSAIRDIGLD